MEKYKVCVRCKVKSTGVPKKVRREIFHEADGADLSFFNKGAFAAAFFWFRNDERGFAKALGV